MARVIWAEPALQDLDVIADYIALDKPDAARRISVRPRGARRRELGLRAWRNSAIREMSAQTSCRYAVSGL